jgi:hypothetical protein
MTARRLPAPWRVEKIPGGYVVRDANGQAFAYVLGGDSMTRKDDVSTWSLKDLKKEDRRLPASDIRGAEARAELSRRQDRRNLWINVISAVAAVIAAVAAIAAFLK